MASDRQIEFLPAGWVWVSAGQQSYTNSRGQASTAKHAYNTRTHESISLRQAQNMQRAARQTAGQPKPPSQPRKGRTRTLKGKYTEQSKNLYAPSDHGRVEVYVYRSIQDARAEVALQGLPDWAQQVLIQVRYTERLKSSGKTGSDKLDKNGHATMSGYMEHDFAIVAAGAYGTSKIGDFDNPWETTEAALADRYDMSGSRARVYLWLGEY